jgi:uncharacterized membrane protein YiaA
LVICYWLFVIGYLLLVIGYLLLVIGYWLLAVPARVVEGSKGYWLLAVPARVVEGLLVIGDNRKLILSTICHLKTAKKIAHICQALSIFIVPMPLKIPTFSANIATCGRDRDVLNC